LEVRTGAESESENKILDSVVLILYISIGLSCTSLEGKVVCMKEKSLFLLKDTGKMGTSRGQASSQGLSLPFSCCVREKSCYNNGRYTFMTNDVCDADSFQEAFVFCLKGIIKSKAL
jgi:hypothetical protein